MVHDVGSQCSNTEGLDGSTSPIIQRKLELDKVFAYLHMSFNISLSIYSTVFVVLLVKILIKSLNEESPCQSNSTVLLCLTMANVISAILNIYPSFNISVSLTSPLSAHA